MKFSFLPVALLAVVIVSGCASMGDRTRNRMPGTWQTTIGGYPVTVVYTRETVKVAGSGPVSYKLVGDRLSFPGGGSQVRVVSFPSRDEMVQTDPMTGEALHYRRVILQ